MSETTAGASPIAARGFVRTWLGLYASPTEEFKGLAAHPGFWAPLGALVLLSFTFTGLWLQRVDPREFLKTQDEESSRFRQMPPEQQASVLEQQTKMFPVIAWVSSTVSIPVVVLAAAGLLLFVFRFVYASDVNFRQALAIACYSFLAVAIVETVLIGAVLQLKGDWNVNPQDAFQASLALALDKASTPHFLYSLAGSLDLLSVWRIALLSIGFAVASRRPVGASVWGVAVPWVIWVLAKATLAAFL